MSALQKEKRREEGRRKEGKVWAGERRKEGGGERNQKITLSPSTFTHPHAVGYFHSPFPAEWAGVGYHRALRLSALWWVFLFFILNLLPSPPENTSVSISYCGQQSNLTFRCFNKRYLCSEVYRAGDIHWAGQIQLILTVLPTHLWSISWQVNWLTQHDMVPILGMAGWGLEHEVGGGVCLHLTLCYILLVKASPKTRLELERRGLWVLGMGGEWHLATPNFYS